MNRDYINWLGDAALQPQSSSIVGKGPTLLLWMPSLKAERHCLKERLIDLPRLRGFQVVEESTRLRICP